MSNKGIENEFFRKEIRTAETFLVEGKEKIVVNGLYGSAKALFLLQLKTVYNKPFLIITKDQNEAEELIHDLQFFSKWSGKDLSILFFPPWDVLPYEYLSPHKDIVGERLSSIQNLSQKSSHFLVAPVHSVIQMLIPLEELRKNILRFGIKDCLDLDIMKDCLLSIGYENVEIVEKKGEFSIRGGIVDCFPSNYSYPFRIELFGDEVESIRRFDIETQVSIERVSHLIILPVREQILNKKLLSQGIKKLKEEANSSAPLNKNIIQLIHKLENFYPFAGAEILNPYFYPNMETLFEYIGGEYLIVFDEPELIENTGLSCGRT